MHRKVPEIVILIHPIEFLICTTLDPLSCPLCHRPLWDQPELLREVAGFKATDQQHPGVTQAEVYTHSHFLNLTQCNIYFVTI